MGSRVGAHIVIFTVVMVSFAGCTQFLPGSGHMMEDPLAALDPFTPVSRTPEHLPVAQPPQIADVADEATFELRASPVQHDVLPGHPVRMFAYNGQLPGPTLRVHQHANITVHFTNDLDVPTTVHWHGIRLDVAYDGVPHAAHGAIPPGGSFDYQLRFPDAGYYWYHPHVREDIQQDMGLMGTILVVPEGNETPLREVPLVLDDVLLDRHGADVAPLYEEATTAALMGRYGNSLLVNAASSWEETAAPGERLRLHLVDTANARPFNLRFTKAQDVELIALDGGFLAAPAKVTTLQLGPGERATVDVLMPQEGNVLFQNDNGVRLATMGRIHVDTSRPSAPEAPPPQEPHRRAAASMESALRHADDARVFNWDLDVTVAANVTNPHAGHAGMEGMSMDEPMSMGPVEWESDDPLAATAVTSHQVRWIIRDNATGRENENISLQAHTGEFVKLRLHNRADSAHPMQHPFHMHGQRFLVLSLDGAPNPRLAWKDTVMVPAGSMVELLVEMSNPGEWMAHCHVSEHLESGMHTTFTVS